MNDIYKDLQAAIAELRSSSIGIEDLYSSPSVDTFLGAPEADSAYQLEAEGSPVLVTGMLELLGLLRAQSWLYRNAHWQVKGDSFYGDHLMFKSLYEGVDKEVDQLAEKTAGYLGSDVLSPILLLEISKKWMTQWEVEECPFKMALKSEADFQIFAKDIYEIFKNSGVMTLGLDDFIMSLASSHDSHTYLISQKLAFKESELGKRAKTVQGSRRLKVANINMDLFLKVGADLLIHKSDKDLWKLTKDAEGKDIIERLYEGDVLKY